MESGLLTENCGFGGKREGGMGKKIDYLKCFFFLLIFPFSFSHKFRLVIDVLISNLRFDTYAVGKSYLFYIFLVHFFFLPTVI